MAPLLIFQWNANGLAAHKIELEKYLIEISYAPDVICIQETFLKPNRPFTLKGYNLVRKDRIEPKGGLITCIKNNINYTEIGVPDDLECIGIEVRMKTSSITVFNIYNKPQLDINSEAFEKLCNNRKTIITGDLNAHNRLWYSESTNNSGKIIEEIIELNNFTVINSAEGTYQKHSGGLSHLD